MPDITNAEFQEYTTLKVENKTLKETAENTRVGLQANREEINKLKWQLTEKDTLIEEKDKVISEKEETLTAKDEEISTIKETADKWTSHEESQKQALSKNIEKMKTDLGDKFNDDVKSFIEDLPDNKVESYLKSIIPSNGAKPPVINGEKWGDWVWWNDPSKFDSLVAGKSASEINVNDMISSLNQPQV